MIDDAKPVLREDPVMAELLEEHDPYAEANWTEFERLCVSIINQQLSTASAAAVKERVFDLLDEDVTPEAVLDADEDALGEAGLSGMKIEYMRNAAEAFRENDLTRAGLADHTPDEVIDELTEIKGVGEWTARMYMMFVLEHEDVLPLGDLAIRRGIEQLYGDGEEELTREEMREIAEAWRPYRSVAARYIWAAYESD
ncbi:DNA-3-methyladenine glycosylase 2 family protein [Halobacteria archaeon HArc-gm2]|nr:DNA-3-methyladenine glycosylase 2 family protein [Halobacteria archaeon HArc-gm2]